MAMLRFIVVVLTLTLAGSAAAQDLGSRAPLKTPGSYPQNVPSPVRQGGDTIAAPWSSRDSVQRHRHHRRLHQ
jgi:hypothetical protein